MTLKGLGWYKVNDLRGLIRDGEVAEYQVTLQLGFRHTRMGVYAKVTEAGEIAEGDSLTVAA